jgi:hypothetical protein
MFSTLIVRVQMDRYPGAAPSRNSRMAAEHVTAEHQSAAALRSRDGEGTG